MPLALIGLKICLFVVPLCLPSLYRGLQKATSTWTASLFPCRLRMCLQGQQSSAASSCKYLHPITMAHVIYSFSAPSPCQQFMICWHRPIACQTCCRAVWPNRGWPRLSSWPPSSCNPKPEPPCLVCSTPGTTASTLSSPSWESSTEVENISF